MVTKYDGYAVVVVYDAKSSQTKVNLVVDIPSRPPKSHVGSIRYARRPATPGRHRDPVSWSSANDGALTAAGATTSVAGTQSFLRSKDTLIECDATSRIQKSVLLLKASELRYISKLDNAHWLNKKTRSPLTTER
jgi:hypothetical protein